VRYSHLWFPHVGRKQLGAAVLCGFALVLLLVCTRRSEPPPEEPDDLCAIFTEKPSWCQSTQEAHARWGVSEAIQLAIIFQESGFVAGARPPRRPILWIIPGRRPSSAYGYAQVVDTTWEEYRARTHRPRARRDDFDDVAHFVAWYLAEIHHLVGISKDDPFNLYLAYHEGPTGYRDRRWQDKKWLHQAASDVARRARTYQTQYDACRDSLPRPPSLWIRLMAGGLLLAVTAAVLVILIRRWLHR
jgi:hypothetical protein